MTKKYKNFSIKADEAGTISGYFSTYDRIPDSYGDVIAPGAFTETIEKRKESGHPFPLCWNHDLDQIIGAVYPEDIKDTDKGPFMEKAVFFDTALAQEKREFVKTGVVYQFSFAYDVLEAGPTELDDGIKAYELKKLDLYEISVVPIPANPRAEVTDIKSMVEEYLKSGRRNSKADEDKIKQAIELLQDVLGELENNEPDGEDGAKGNAAAEDQKRRNLEALKTELEEFLKERKL